MPVPDYSTTPASNTTISGINIAEGCSPAGINNAIRQLMADVRAFYDAPPFPSGAAASGANTDITALDQDVTVTATGTIAANTLGYRGLPQNAQTSAYVLVLADQGKHISITTGGVAIPANGSVPFPIGSTIVIYNNSASTQTVTITTDTLRLAGTTSTGTRTIAARGLCTLVKVGTTEWLATGNVT
jgi:hypothetical protein